MDKTISNRSTDSSLYIKATVGCASIGGSGASDPRLPSYHTHTQNRQTTKEQKQKVLLSFQLPSNNKTETYNLFASEDTITLIRPSRLDGYLRGAYVEKASVDWYFLPPLIPASSNISYGVVTRTN